MEDNDSEVISTSIPYIAFQNVNSAYVYGEGQTSIYSDLPDVLAIAVDTVVGFEGGYGGKTGMDSIKILKSDITEWPDTISLGGKDFHPFKNTTKRTTESRLAPISSLQALFQPRPDRSGRQLSESRYGLHPSNKKGVQRRLCY